jgi:multicomponent Na+:H+ antiporter subunit D
MSSLVIIPVLVALVTAVATLGVRFAPRLQQALSLSGAVAYFAATLVLARSVLTGASPDPSSGEGAAVLVYQLSGWEAPFGITLVADALAVFFLLIAGIVAVAASAYAVRSLDAVGQRVSFHPLFHFMLVGVTGSLLTGDLFNLFVWFEVMLMPSYVLVVFYSGEQHTSAALKYTALNLVGSAFMLLAIGGIYATTGTLNMADVARRLAAAGQYGIDPAPVLGIAGLLFAVFLLKAGVVPFQFWVPSAYSAAPAPATAMLAGVTKKVGVYAVIRVGFTVFGGASLSGGLALPGFSGTGFLAFFGPVLFVMATASIIFGGLGATSREELDDVLSYSSIGQVGFILLPVAVAATVADPAIQALGIVAALVYSLNHALAKGLLFLLAGSLESAVGTMRLENLGGMARTHPAVAGVFFLGSLSLVGIPPLTGFFGKLLVFDTAGRALNAGEPGSALALGVALLGAILTIAYLSRAWGKAFWGDGTDLVANATPSTMLVAIGAVLAVGIVALGVGFDPVLGAARAGAEAALDQRGYVEAVLPEVSQ